MRRAPTAQPCCAVLASLAEKGGSRELFSRKSAMKTILGFVPIASAPQDRNILQSYNLLFPVISPDSTHFAVHSPLFVHLPQKPDDLAHLQLSMCGASAWAHFLTHFLQQSLRQIRLLPLDQLLKVLHDSQLCFMIARILMRELLIY